MKETASTHPGTPVVAVVNDDAVQLRMLTGLLQKAGLAPRAFTGAEEALQVMADAPPALIVTDLYMPGLDGWRFCRLLRSPAYTGLNAVPILVVSATFTGDEPQRITVELGADAFMPAPVDGRHFTAQVQALLKGTVMRQLPRVLIVTDDVKWADMMKHTFATNGYETAIAATVRKAESALTGSAWDLAVLNDHLPDGRGADLLEMLQARQPDCVCLIITSDAGSRSALQWMKQGAADCIHTPFEPEYLIEVCVRARRERALLRVEHLLEQRTCELRLQKEQWEKRATEQRLLLDTIDNQIWYVTDRRTWGRVNRAHAAFLGRHPRDLAYQKPVDILSEAVAETFATGDADIFETGQPLKYEASATDAQGRTRLLHITKIPCLNDAGQVRFVVCSAVDITERKAMEAQLLQAQKLESVGRLAGGVAHDFNNMLGVILGHVEMAFRHVDGSHPLQDDLTEIQNAAQRSARLTQQLLAFARKQVIKPEVLDVNTTIENMLTMLRRVLGEDIELIWQPGYGLPTIKADPSQMDQILVNLCINARNAIDGVGRVTIETSSQVFDAAWCEQHSGYLSGAFVRLAVTDSGCGMDEDTLKQIFDPFFTTREVGQGTGLGLSTVHGIVHQNRGFIRVSSQPGQGSVFTIYLPRHASAADPPTLAEMQQTIPRGHETILLVEDEPALLRMIKVMLEHLGYTVLTAAHPEQALQLARTHTNPIHLLITDVVLPCMNGRELATQLTTAHAGLRCLFISGYTADVIGRHGVLQEGEYFIQKPFGVRDLGVKVREVLEQ